jgi:hypothetical protein
MVSEEVVSEEVVSEEVVSEEVVGRGGGERGGGDGWCGSIVVWDSSIHPLLPVVLGRCGWWRRRQIGRDLASEIFGGQPTRQARELRTRAVGTQLLRRQPQPLDAYLDRLAQPRELTNRCDGSVSGGEGGARGDVSCLAGGINLGVHVKAALRATQKLRLPEYARCPPLHSLLERRDAALQHHALLSCGRRDGLACQTMIGDQGWCAQKKRTRGERDQGWCATGREERDQGW